MTISTPLRRALLFIPPALLVPAMIYHQIPSQIEQPVIFGYLHLLLLPLFGLLGISGWLLTWGLSSYWATLSRVGVFCFVVGYIAFDAIWGITASVLMAQSGDTTLAFSVNRTLEGYIPLWLGMYGWKIGMIAAAVALYRAGKPLLPLLVLAGTALVLDQHHGGLNGVIIFGGFLVAAAWLEWAEVRQPAPRVPIPVEA